MAQKTVVTVVCDLPHDELAEGAETISFALDSTGYEIDVCAVHAKDLLETFAGYVDHARTTGRVPSRNFRPRPKASRDRSADIRRWAREQGVVVSDRGRLPVDLVREYDAAH